MKISERTHPSRSHLMPMPVGGNYRAPSVGWNPSMYWRSTNQRDGTHTHQVARTKYPKTPDGNRQNDVEPFQKDLTWLQLRILVSARAASLSRRLNDCSMFVPRPCPAKVENVFWNYNSNGYVQTKKDQSISRTFLDRVQNLPFVFWRILDLLFPSEWKTSFCLVQPEMLMLNNCVGEHNNKKEDTVGFHTSDNKDYTLLLLLCVIWH